METPDKGKSSSSSNNHPDAGQMCKSVDSVNKNSERAYFEQKRITLYKTEMCRNYEERGLCKYAERCQFAHSTDELRQKERHPLYKTAMCKTFSIEGECPYGKRCCFVHDEYLLARKMRKFYTSSENCFSENDKETYMRYFFPQKSPSCSKIPFRIENNEDSTESDSFPLDFQDITASVELRSKITISEYISKPLKIVEDCTDLANDFCVRFPTTMNSADCWLENRKSLFLINLRPGICFDSDIDRAAPGAELSRSLEKSDFLP